MPRRPLRPAPCSCLQDIVPRPELAPDHLGPLASEADGAEAAAAERKLAHAASSSSDELRASSANHIQSYISTHYNVRAMQQGVRPCRSLRGRGVHVWQPEHVCWSGFAAPGCSAHGVLPADCR